MAFNLGPFDVGACVVVRTKNKLGNAKLDVNVKLKLDRRTSFVDVPDEDNMSKNFHGKVDIESCFQLATVQLKKLFNPRGDEPQLTFSFEISSSALNKDDMTFGAIDPRKPRTAILNLPFNLGCGNDNICVYDLSVKTSFGQDVMDPLVIGSRKNLTQMVQVSNENGDPAFAPAVRIAFPPQLSIRQTPPECKVSENLGQVVCEIYGPLDEGRSHTFKILYDASRIEPFTNQLFWDRIEVFSDSKNHREIDLTNNIGSIVPISFEWKSKWHSFFFTATAKLQLSTEIDLEVKASNPSKPIKVEETEGRLTNVSFTDIFQIRNRLPSPAREIRTKV